MEDIRETGPVGLKGLNRQKNIQDMSLEEQWASIKNIPKSAFSSAPEENIGRAAMEAGYGDSQYDEGITSDSQFQDIGDIRYNNQPWYDTFANGVGKMLGTAGTTFLSSLVGLPYGLVEVARQQRGSAIWDNEVTDALAKVDELLENNMTNYRSQEQQNAAWYEAPNLLSMNFLADDVIKNVGFTLGAGASMMVGGGGAGLVAKSLGLVNKAGKVGKAAGTLASALFSATGEGMIEAKQGVNERNKLELQKLDDALAPEYAQLDAMEKEAQDNYALTGDYGTYKAQLQGIMAQRKELDNRKTLGQQQIEESGLDMGNKILGFNQALLTAGNLIQFSKGITKSFNKARHAAEVADKYSRPFGASVVRAGKDIAEGYALKGKGLGRLIAGTKGILTEGSEEMNQQWIQSASGAYYNREDTNDYWKAKTDPEAYKAATEGLYTVGRAISKGFDESWGDLNQWEQFVIGGLTGALGTYMPTKVFNQDKTKSKWNPARYGSWEGGFYNELSDFNKEYNQAQDNVNQLNEILAKEDFPSRIRSMIGHTYMETQKEKFVNEDDMKAWKDADDKQNIIDIQAFLRTGKLDDLRAIYKSMGEELTDDDIASIVKSTTQKKTTPDGKDYYVGAFVDADGNQTVSNDEIRQEIKHNSEELERKLNSYLDSIKEIQDKTGGQLTNDQEDNLAYLHNMSKESLVRMEKIIDTHRPMMPKVFLMKTNKTPEELGKEYASSELAFTKNEDTKEGYVEVDTSLLNPSNFADFFQREVIRGEHIDPEFSETAEEKAVREEEEKNMTEAQRRARAKERLSKKWKEGIEKRQADATEQWLTNYERIEGTFYDTFKKNNPKASRAEADAAFDSFVKDLVDSSKLYNQAGEFNATLREYMQNPSLIDKAKEKEEAKAEKAEAESQMKSKFAGKEAKQMVQDLANGTMSQDEFDDFEGADLSGVTDDDLKAAQGEATKAKESMEKGALLKQHIQENLGENPTAEELSAAQTAMQMVDDAVLNADNPEDINIDSPELNQMPVEDIDPNASIEDVEAQTQTIQGMIADAFNALKEDEASREDIPEEVPDNALEGVEAPVTGNDEGGTVPADVVAPDASSESDTRPAFLPMNPLTSEAIDTIIKDTEKLYDRPTGENGVWRTTTTRYRYGKDSGPYHESLNPDSKEYKRSKAIWDFFNANGVFDRLDNPNDDRIKNGDTIHLMVKYFPEVFGARLEEVSDEDKPYAMALLMVNDNGEILGDLPLAELEPSFRKGEPSSQVSLLKALQDKVFKAFYENHAKRGGNEAVVDSKLTIDGIDNLNLTFKNGKPLVSRVKQKMRGVVPYSTTETNTLNKVAGDGKLTLGVRVTDNNVALKRGDRNTHKEVRIPRTGNLGQPYIMLPTSTGESYAIPIYMNAFNAEQHKDTELYKMLCNAVHYLLQSTNMQEAQKKAYFQKHMDVLSGLLQVTRQEGKAVVEATKDTVTLHLQSITDPSVKYDISVENNAKSSELAPMLVNQLSGIPINVSIEFLNDKIETGIATKYAADYNKVIGEIATVNLPENTQHTVNDWFTIELATDEGIKPSPKVPTRATGIVTQSVGNRTLEFNVDKGEIVDTTSGEILHGDEEANLAYADIVSRQPINQGKERIQINVDGSLRTYDIKEKKFVKISEQKASVKPSAKPQETPPSSLASNAPSIAQPKPEEKPQEMNLEDSDRRIRLNGAIVGRQNKEAWEAIPEDLRGKFLDGDIALEISYNGITTTIVASNPSVARETLKKANIAAKTGSMVAKEAVKPMKKAQVTIDREDILEARRWLARALPSLSAEERVQFVDKLARGGDNAPLMWGSYRRGVIEIQRNAPMGTVYHEAFHYVVDMLLSDEERNKMLETAMKEYGISNKWDAEERLANDFRRYAIDENATGIIATIKMWIRKIMEKMQRYNRISDSSINALFRKINNGELAEKAKEVESFAETQQKILMEIRNIQQQRYSWKNLSPETRQALKESGYVEEFYEMLSLEEKEQAVKCRG